MAQHGALNSLRGIGAAPAKKRCGAPAA